MSPNKIRKQKKGVVAIEAAITLPVLILITLAGLQYGWLFLKYQEVTNVARHAIRRCVRPDIDCPATMNWIDGEMAKRGFTSDEYDYVVSWANPSAANGVGSPVHVRLWVYGPKVDIINFLPVPEKLTAYCTMSEEGSTY